MRLRVQGQLGALGGVVHPVVDVEAPVLLVAYPAAAHVGLVRQDQGGGGGVHREGGGVVVVADGGDDGGHVRGLHPHLVQDAEGHDRPGLGVVVAVDHIADVVHEAGNPGQLLVVLPIAQLVQDAGGVLGAAGHVGEAVLGKAPGHQGLVGLGDVGADLLGLAHLLVGDVHGGVSSPVSFVSYRYIISGGAQKARKSGAGPEYSPPEPECYISLLAATGIFPYNGGRRKGG